VTLTIYNSIAAVRKFYVALCGLLVVIDGPLGLGALTFVRQCVVEIVSK